MTAPNLSLVLIMVCFWATLFLVYRYLIVPVNRVLEERNARIDGAEREWTARNDDYLAATARLEEELAEAGRQSAALRDRHRQEAQSVRQLRLEETRLKADERLLGALDELAQDESAARSELRQHAEVLAREFAGRLLGREVAS
jgi:F-type H+-transporting ATPase subunit b